MSAKADWAHLQIKYKDAEATFEGTLEETWLLFEKFLNEYVPSFEIAGKLWLVADVQALAKDCEGLIGFSREGSSILAPKNRLTDNETIALWLLASYLGKRLNILETEGLSKEDLQAKLGKTSKITSTRLGELMKIGAVGKTTDDKCKITEFGVSQMQKDVLPRIITKTGI